MTELNPDTIVWDMWTKEHGNVVYLGRGTAAELAKHNARAEAAGFAQWAVVTKPNLPPSLGQVVVHDYDPDKE